MLHKLYSILFLTIFLNCVVVEHSFAQEKAKKDQKQSGSLDFGGTVSNGNSKEESIQSNLKHDYKFNKLVSNTFRARAENKELNGNRTKEEYFTNNQTRRDFGKNNFKFLELEFISDRFGGYKYRISETAGVGRNLLESEMIHLTIQSSAGMRQRKLITGEKNNNLIVRFGSNIDVKFSDHVSFEEHLDISSDSHATIIRSDANVKVLISKKLYLKFGVLIERVSNVPSGVKNSDITSALKIGYEF